MQNNELARNNEELNKVNLSTNEQKLKNQKEQSELNHKELVAMGIGRSPHICRPVKKNQTMRTNDVLALDPKTKIAPSFGWNGKIISF